MGINSVAISIGYWISGAAMTVAAYAAFGEPVSAQQVPQACGASDASILNMCARSCFAICRDSTKAIPGSPIGRACNDLIRQPTRIDQPRCGDVFAAVDRKKPVSLQDAINACTANAVTERIRLPNFSSEQGEQIVLDACFRGMDHLDCVIDALLAEAASIKNSYEVIIKSNYPNLADVQTVCAVSVTDLSQHMDAAASFDAKANTLRATFTETAQCTDKTRTTIEKMVLDGMNRPGELLKSMINKISEPINRASERQRDVEELVGGIGQSQRAMQTVRTIRAVFCK